MKQDKFHVAFNLDGAVLNIIVADAVKVAPTPDHHAVLALMTTVKAHRLVTWDYHEADGLVSLHSTLDFNDLNSDNYKDRLTLLLAYAHKLRKNQKMVEVWLDADNFDIFADDEQENEGYE